MKIIKLLGLAFFATLAFSAIGALGAGSASALLFLTLSGGELLFEIKSLLHLNATPLEPTLLSSLGVNVECLLLLGRGAILNKTDEARKILLIFHGCKLAGQTTTCQTNPNEPGLIKTLLLDALLVTLLLVGTLDKYALEILSEVRRPHLATFNCGPIVGTVTVEGSVVGDFEESLTQSQTLKLEAALLFGKFVSQHFWTLEGISSASLTANGFPAEEDALVDIKADGKVAFSHSSSG